MRALAILLLILAAPLAAAPASAQKRADDVPRLVVLDVATEEKGIKPSTLAGIVDLLTLELTRYRGFDVISGREIRDALQLESERQTLGCDAAACAAEIAQAFGARYVVFAVLTRIGSSYVLNLSLFDSTDARIVGRAAAQASTVAGIPPLLPQAAATLVEDVAGSAARAPSPLTAQPKQGAPRAPIVAPQGPVAYPVLDDDEVPLQRGGVDPRQADSLCGYDGELERWSCGAGGQVHVDVAWTGSASTAAVARFRPLYEGPCLRGVDVEIVSGDEPVVVDWREAVFVIDGEAQPAASARAHARPVTAPPRASARERLYSTFSSCLGGAWLDPRRESDAVSLTVPYAVGATPARAKWLRRRTREAVDEASLLRMLPRPSEPPRPSSLLEEGADPPFFWGTTTGAGVALAGSAAAGLFVATAWMPQSSGLGARAVAGAGWAGVAGALLVVPALGAGFLWDAVARIGYELESRRSHEYRREKRRVDAYDRAVAAASSSAAPARR